MCIYIYIYVYICIYTCVYIYTHTYMHIYVQSHTEATATRSASAWLKSSEGRPYELGNVLNRMLMLVLIMYYISVNCVLY